MAVLTVEQIKRSGLVPASAANAAGGGDSFPNDGRTFVEITNGHSSAQTVTFATQKTVAGYAVEDQAVEIDDGDRQLIGPFAPDIFNDVNGRVQITYSGVTNLTVSVFRL